MATTADGQVTLVRVLEYTGTSEQLTEIVSKSRIPLQGEQAYPNGVVIRSGVVVWNAAVQVDEQPKARVPYVPPPSGRAS